MCECVREVSGCVGGVLKCLLLTHLQRKAEIPTRLDRVVVHRVGIQVQTSALTPDLPRFGHMLHGLAEHGHLSDVALLAPHLHQDLRHDGGNDDRSATVRAHSHLPHRYRPALTDAPYADSAQE